MKILIIGGMHGNEPLGVKLVKLLKMKPIPNVDVIFANEEAVKANERFKGKDLNRSFPGEKNSKDYEDIRARQLLKITKKYDVVLDFHNTYCPDNDCGFVGDEAPQGLYNVAGLLGLDRVIVADYDCINKYAPNCLSVEVSMESNLNKPVIWYERIELLSRLDDIRVMASIQKYRFVYRMTVDDRDQLKLPDMNLRAFVALSPSLAKAMNVESPAYPIFVGDKFTPYNYGGLLNKIQ